MEAHITENVTEVKEFVYEYQPQDKLGRNLGNKQIFKGSSVQEVLDKVAEANKNLVQLNRDLTRKIRLGEYEKDALPNDVSKVTSRLLKPKELSIEEKAQFARDILDPEKFDDVNSRLIEAQLGAKPEEIRNRINNQEQRLSDIEARQEAEAFAYANQDYFACRENFETITSWMVKNQLSPIRENFQLAYDTLKKEGLILQAPVEAPVSTVSVSNTPVEPIPTPTQTPTPAPAPTPTPIPARAPSGLTRELASNNGTPPERISLTVKQINDMPSEEYKRRLRSDPTFAKQVDELLSKKVAR